MFMIGIDPHKGSHTAAAVDRSELVIDKLSSRMRLLERGRIDKTDPNYARSAAIIAWHNPTLNVVAGLDEHRILSREVRRKARRTHTERRLWCSPVA